MSEYTEIKAGIVFRNQDTYLFVKERGGKWGVPKGHAEKIDKNDPKRTAIREVNEETNIVVQYDALQAYTSVHGNKLYLLDINCERRFLTIPEKLQDDKEIVDFGWFTKEYARTLPLNSWARHLVNRVPYF
jgi:8-oxo-dGTP pyrophosphatase MutT (NUDIX family)